MRLAFRLFIGLMIAAPCDCSWAQPVASTIHRPFIGAAAPAAPVRDAAPSFAPSGTWEAQVEANRIRAFKEAPTFWQIVEAAADETTTAYVFRDSPVFVPDPDYKPTVDELEARKQGLPKKYWYNLLGVSKAHSDYLTELAHLQFEREQTLARAGWMGTFARLVFGILDPLHLGIGIAALWLFGRPIARRWRKVRFGAGRIKPKKAAAQNASLERHLNDMGASSHARQDSQIPDLSPEMLAAANEASAWCLSQVGSFVGHPVEKCPMFSTLDDERIAAYACGFISGYLQFTRIDYRWGHGNRGVMDMGHIALCSISLIKILGAERFEAIMPRLPGWGNAEEDLKQMDIFGGTDGMAHASGTEKQNGGMLLMYLHANVKR